MCRKEEPYESRPDLYDLEENSEYESSEEETGHSYSEPDDVKPFGAMKLQPEKSTDGSDYSFHPNPQDEEEDIVDLSSEEENDKQNEDSSDEQPEDLQTEANEQDQPGSEESGGSDSSPPSSPQE